MTGYTDTQLHVWLRGLLAIAWADGDFTADERTTIIDLTQTELTPGINLRHLEPISIDELVASFGHCSHMAENFLRTAMMVAVADGVYSPPEATLLREFYQALNVDTQVLTALESTMVSANTSELGVVNTQKIDSLLPVREWLDGLEIHDPRLARLLCCPSKSLSRYVDVAYGKVIASQKIFHHNLVKLRLRSVCLLLHNFLNLFAYCEGNEIAQENCYGYKSPQCICKSHRIFTAMR